MNHIYDMFFFMCWKLPQLFHIWTTDKSHKTRLWFLKFHFYFSLIFKNYDHHFVLVNIIWNQDWAQHYFKSLKMRVQLKNSTCLGSGYVKFHSCVTDTQWEFGEWPYQVASGFTSVKLPSCIVRLQNTIYSSGYMHSSSSQ